MRAIEVVMAVVLALGIGAGLYAVAEEPTSAPAGPSQTEINQIKIAVAVFMDDERAFDARVVQGVLAMPDVDGATKEDWLGQYFAAKAKLGGQRDPTPFVATLPNPLKWAARDAAKSLLEDQIEQLETRAENLRGMVGILSETNYNIE